MVSFEIGNIWKRAKDKVYGSWPVRFSKRHSQLGGVGVGLAAWVGWKLAWRKAAQNPVVFKTAMAIPITAYATAVAMVVATEYFVGEKEAEALGVWYVDAVTDPYAWHVETDRVTQGAAHAIIDDFSESMVANEEMMEDIGDSLWQRFWASEEAQAGWRKVGGML